MVALDPMIPVTAAFRVKNLDEYVTLWATK